MKSLLKMAFSVQFGPQASKFIKKLDSNTKERIKAKVQRLCNDPFPSETERVEGYKGEKVFRVRVGDYRILYIVRYVQSSIIIVSVDKRSRVYG